MPNYTKNLNLFKYDPSTDGSMPFDVQQALNDNFDKIDASLGSLEICDIGMSLYVDESKGKRRYLNGQIVERNTNTEAFFTRLKEITTLYPSLLCTEEEWQITKTMSAFGQVGKFVFNYSSDEIVSVRIPAIVNLQGLFDLQNLGMTVSAGLPNIEGLLSGTTTITFYDGGYGALRGKNQSSWDIPSGHSNGSDPSNGSGTGGNDMYFDASLSNPIYGNSSTVQQEAIQYPYFIQIATGAETEANIINTFTNATPQTLLESKYSKKPLYNECWLASNGQWNDKGVYVSVYEALLVEYNTEIETGTTVELPSGKSYTKRGLSVKLSTEEYTDYDFVINTTDEKFMLPLFDGSEDLPSNVYENLTLGASGETYIAPANGYLYFSKKATAASQGVTFICNEFELNQTASKTDENVTLKMRVNRNDEIAVNYNLAGTTQGFKFIKAKGNGTLYYYVGDTDQNHGIVNMGRISETLTNKVDKANIKWAINAVTPDFANPIVSQVTLPNKTNVDYTATQNCMVWVLSNGYTGNNNMTAIIYDKDTGIILDINNGYTLWGASCVAKAVIPKGKTVQLQVSNDASNAVERCYSVFPLIGDN